MDRGSLRSEIRAAACFPRVEVFWTRFDLINTPFSVVFSRGVGIVSYSLENL